MCLIGYTLLNSESNIEEYLLASFDLLYETKKIRFLLKQIVVRLSVNILWDKGSLISDILILYGVDYNKCLL